MGSSRQIINLQENVGKPKTEWMRRCGAQKCDACDGAKDRAGHIGPLFRRGIK